MMSGKGSATKRTYFTRGSGNIFADIGLHEPEEALAKARLAEAIAETIRRRGLTQAESAAIMGVDQPKVSQIVNGRLSGYTQDRLIRYLTALGDDVEILVRYPDHYAGDERGRLSVRLP
jgi:predicted XRE-type DNA-binding protein